MATLFIGFDKFCVFDYPLLASGNEDIYFTVAPSPYLSEQAFRRILYDHIYSRRSSEPDWEKMPGAQADELRRYYRNHRDEVPGVGYLRQGLWIPGMPETQV
jgi:hypothetical protein